MAYYYLPFSTNFLTSTYTFINLQKIFFTKMLVFGIKIKGRCLNSYCQTKSHFDVLVGEFWEKQCDLVLLLQNIKTWRNCINSDIKLPDIQHLYITYFIRYHQNCGVCNCLKLVFSQYCCCISLTGLLVLQKNSSWSFNIKVMIYFLAVGSVWYILKSGNRKF